MSKYQWNEYLKKHSNMQSDNSFHWWYQSNPCVSSFSVNNPVSVPHGWSKSLLGAQPENRQLCKLVNFQISKKELFSPIALCMAKTQWNIGHFECNGVNKTSQWKMNLPGEASFLSERGNLIKIFIIYYNRYSTSQTSRTTSTSMIDASWSVGEGNR